VPGQIVVVFVAELKMYRFRLQKMPIPELSRILENDNTPVS
jgi:hypothetical protein